MLWDRSKYEAGGLSSTRQLINQHTLDHLFTLVYVITDDHLKTSPQHPRFTFPTSARQKVSDAELMTITLLGEFLDQADAGAWFALVKRDHTDAFPALPDVTRYSRVTRNLLRVWAGLALCLANTVEDDTVYVVDSQPIPVSSARGSGTLEP